MNVLKISKKEKQEVINGFRLAGGIVLGVVLMGGLVAGTGSAFGTMETWVQPRLVGAFVALGCLLLIALMVGRWAKYFAGWIAYSVLNGLIMVGTGHLVNDPSVRVSRVFALSMTLVVVVTASVSWRFAGKNYELNQFDKVALITWVLSFDVSANAERFGLAPFGFACLILVAAWWYHRSTSRKLHNRDSNSVAIHGSEPIN